MSPVIVRLVTVLGSLALAACAESLVAVGAVSTAKDVAGAGKAVEKSMPGAGAASTFPAQPVSYCWNRAGGYAYQRSDPHCLEGETVLSEAEYRRVLRERR